MFPCPGGWGASRLLTSTAALSISTTKQNLNSVLSLKSALHSAAVPAAEHPSKTQTLPPVADSGHLSQVGRKPKGQHADELDKNYRRTGLRGNWHKP
eukprot:1149914-Pelagomonas_calceolata.AAC.1